MNGRWCMGCSFLPSPLQSWRKSISGSQREFRWTVDETPSQYLTEHTEMGGGGVGLVGSMVPGVQACCQSLTKGAPFRGGSWGFLGEEVVCAGGCDAWGVCHSGRGCGCHEECHRDSGRSRWPFHWVLAGHSQSALWWFEETGRKQWDRDG